MKADTKYRHNNPACTYDIYVTKIQYLDKERIKINYRFITKQGLVVDYREEKAILQRKNLKDWKEIV